MDRSLHHLFLLPAMRHQSPQPTAGFGANVNIVRPALGCRLCSYENSLQRYLVCLHHWIGAPLLLCSLDDDSAGQFYAARLPGLRRHLVAPICCTAWSQGRPRSLCDARRSGAVLRNRYRRVRILLPQQARLGKRRCLRLWEFLRKNLFRLPQKGTRTFHYGRNSRTLKLQSPPYSLKHVH